MKIVHSNKDLHNTADSWSMAQQYEQEGRPEDAVSVYLKLLKKQPLNERIYDRLMILYRKMKEWKKELDIIKTGIRVFEESFNKKHKAPAKKIATLSKALMKATGLADKKGKSLYAPEPMARWQKRKNVLEKKLKK